MREPTYKRPRANRVTETRNLMSKTPTTAINQEREETKYYDGYGEELSPDIIRILRKSQRDFEQGLGTPYEYG